MRSPRLSLFLLITLSLGAFCTTPAPSFLAFPNVPTTSVSHFGTVFGSDLFFASTQSDGLSIQKLTSAPNGSDLLQVQGISFKIASASVISMTNSFSTIGSISMAAASLSTGEVIIFDSNLVVHSVFTLALNSSTTMICTALTFSGANLTCFGSSTIVVMAIAEKPVTARSLATATTGESKNDVTVTVTSRHALSYGDQSFGKITGASVYDGYFFFSALALASGNTKTTWKLCRVKEDFSQVYIGNAFGTVGSESASQTQIIPAAGPAGSFIYASRADGMDTPGTTSVTVTSFKPNGDSKDDYRTRSIIVNAPQNSSSVLSMAVTVSATSSQAVVLVDDYVHRFDPSAGMSENGVDHIVSNNCASFKATAVIPVGSEYWLIGYVESPSAKISQSSFLQVLRMSTSGSLTSNSIYYNFYTFAANDNWTETDYFAFFSWGAGTATAITAGSASPSTSSDFSTQAAVIAISGARTAETVKNYLEPFTTESLKSGVSISDTFTTSTLKTVLDSPVDWMTLATDKISGTVPTDADDNVYVGAVYGVTDSNPLLSCAKLPIVAEKVAFNNGDSFAKFTATGGPHKPSAGGIKGTANGDFFMWGPTGEKNLLVGRLFSTGEMNWAAEVDIPSDDVPNVNAYIPINSTYDEYISSVSLSSVARLQKDKIVWIQEVGDMTIQTVAVADKTIYVFGSQALVVFDLMGNTLAQFMITVDGFNEYNFSERSLSIGSDVYVLATSGSSVAVIQVTKNFTVGFDYETYELSASLALPILVEGSTATSLMVVGGNANGILEIVELDFTNNGSVTSSASADIDFSAVHNVVAQSTSSILVVATTKFYILDLSNKTGISNYDTVNTMSCTSLGATLWGSNYAISKDCVPILAGAQLGILTLTATGDITPKGGNNVVLATPTDFKLQPVSSTVTTTKISSTVTDGHHHSTGQYRGKVYGFPTTFPLAMTVNILPFSPPNDLGTHTQTLLAGNTFTASVTLSEFVQGAGSNSGNCILVGVHAGGMSYTPADHNTRGVLQFDSTHTTPNDLGASGSVLARCNTWITGRYGVILTVNNPNGPSSPESASWTSMSSITFVLSSLIFVLFAQNKNQESSL